MQTPLLQTKLYIPPSRPELVSRSRLIERLNAGLNRQFTLISASTGFGKTTLVCDWLRQLDQPAAWLSLDKDDNDLARFITYFTATLQQIAPEIGQTAQDLLQSSLLPAPDTLMTLLINDLVAIQNKFVLILDDYHLIDTPTIHQALAFLLDHLPPYLHLVIISRTDPPFSQSRLRAQGQMMELREFELRFSSTEATTFLNTMMGLSLAEKDIAVLEARTEGWIAGLQLAALSMQDRADIGAFIHSFTGSHRYILDYLADEVLSQQPEEIRRFLLQTSILNRLCASLCDALFEQDNSQTVLASLETANLFLVPLDNDRHWYRYHHLFSDLLRHYLAREFSPEMIKALHQRAYDWYLQQGLPEEALEHALIAADFDRVTELLDQLFWPLIMRGEISRLLRWFKKLSDEHIRSQPRLSLYCAWTHLASLLLDDVEFYVQSAEAILRANSVEDQTLIQDERNLFGEINALRAFLIRVRGKAAEAIGLYQQAQEQISEDYAVVHGVILVDLARAYVMMDDLPTAQQTLTKAITLNQSLGNVYMVLFAVSIMAEVDVSQGHLYQAADRYQQTLQQMTATGQPLPPLAGSLYAGLAELNCEWHNLAQATDYANKAIELGERFNFSDGLFQGYLALGRIQQVQGEFEAALQAFQEAERIIRQSQTAQWTLSITAYQARLHLMQYRADGDDAQRQASLRWAQSSPLYNNWKQQIATALLPSHPVDFTHLTLARILIMRDEVDEALSLLNWLHQAAEAAGRTRSIIEILILQALALDQIGDQDQAETQLQEALTRAQPEGYIQLFVNEGKPLAPLLQAAIHANIVPNYTSKLLAIITSDRSMDQMQAPISPDQSHLIEPLSKRELEVLELIAEGQSNRDIAETLVLALGTVKRHTNNIYGKLQVGSRTEAVAKARGLKLL